MPRRPPHPQLSLLGTRLKLVRSEAGWSQERLADAIGIKSQSISQYETGKASLRISTLLSIAEVLHVGIGSLLDVKLPLPVAAAPPEGAEIMSYYLKMSAADRALAVRLVRDVATERGHPGS